MAGIPRAGELFAGRYRVVSEIGRGGMGIVFAVHDEELGRDAALKVLLPSLTDDEFRLRFQREATVLARIRSRHIVTIYDVGELGDLSYLITEILPDGDLRSWLDRKGPMPHADAVSLLAQVSEALVDAHAVGVVHRDVKPGNVLLWDRPRGLVPYLCDFGIAVAGESNLTRSGMLVGSPSYMAPERHFGHPADERGDIYSAGCLLWSVLTGDAPYAGTDFQVANSHINGAIPQLGTGDRLDDAIDELLRNCMGKDPDDRFQSAVELQHELLALSKTTMATAPAAKPVGTGAADDTNFESAVGAAPSGPSRAEVTILKQSSSGERPTVLKSPPVPPADELAPSEPDGRRRWFIIAALSAVLAMVIGSGVVLAARQSRNGGPETSHAAAAATPEPLPTPGRPEVSRESRYRAVSFRLRVPTAASEPGFADAATVVQWRDGNRWVTAPKRIRRPTEAGGDRVCIRARTQISDGTQQAASDPVQVCGRSAARTVRLVRNASTCRRTNYQGYTFACQYFDVVVTGFKSGSRPTAVIRPETGRNWCDDPAIDAKFCRPVRVGADGRGRITKYFGVATDLGRVVLTVDGVRSAQVHVFCPRGKAASGAISCTGS